MIQDTWYEGGEPGFMRCADSGTFTYHSGTIAASDPAHGGSSNAVPAILVDNFRGNLSFIFPSFLKDNDVRVQGDGGDTRLLLLGMGGHGTNYFQNDSPLADVRRLMTLNSQRAPGDGWTDDPDFGRVDADFLSNMLAQTRSEKPGFIRPKPDGVTDARFYRIWVESALTGIELTSTNSPPMLVSIPDIKVHAGTLACVTNQALDADLPFQTLTFSLLAAPPTAQINPTNGVFTWTPARPQGPGTNLIVVCVTDDGWPRLSATNAFAVIVNNVNHAPSLNPFPITDLLSALDIGDPSDPLEPGTTTFNADSSIRVVAGGSGFSSNDHYHFTYQKVKGDFDIRVQVDYLQARDAGSAAGLMVRETLEPDSRFHSLQILPSGPTLDGDYGNIPGANVYWGRCRLAQGAYPADWVYNPGVNYPNAWIRLKRQGPNLTAFRSDDGTNWTDIGDRTAAPAYPDEVFLGLATFSANNSPAQTVQAHYLNYGPFPPPAPNPITDRNINELQPLSFQVAGYDLDVPIQNLTYSLDPGAPAGASIDPTNGWFSWTPTAEQGPSTNLITIRVTDDGLPPLSDARTFTVVVNEVNQVPVLPVIARQTVNELTLLTVTNTATESNIHSTLGYSLVNPPVGVSIAPNGVITWTPSEAQGPGTNVITTVATSTNLLDLVNPTLSASNSFTVVVNEVNTAPVIGAINDLTVNPGQPVGLAVPATDSDLPTNSLAFALLASPSGMTLNAASGWLAWRPTMAQANTTNVVRLQVTDDNPWAINAQQLSATQSFRITVNPLTPVTLQPLAHTNDSFSLSVSGPVGPDYILQGSPNMQDWLSLASNAPLALPFTLSDTNTATFTNRFYRVRLGP